MSDISENKVKIYKTKRFHFPYFTTYNTHYVNKKSHDRNCE